MITKTVGRYTINYVPELELATVTIWEFFVREVVFEAHGKNCFSECEQWIAEQ